MNSVHYLHDDITVVGWACRLPGANSISELWSLLLEGRCAITSVPSDRFSLDRFGHPGRQQRGKSYTWAAGVLDDVWGFDPTVFGISPREAEQIDPQQRILLQLTWEALEDAGIRPSSIAGSDVGVFVGASQSDYGHAFFADHAVADSHFATGTALAILANRISYIYDLHGPSIAVDTACSSSLVALHQAMEALRSGRIDTAIVGGINMILSPASFIAFSQASMLSPTGLCQAFSAKADGFVRAEGGTVLVLRKAALAQTERNPIHGRIIATDVNSDGRTNGISLPSLDSQEALLKRIYSRSAIDVDHIAFVEAHGTGTAAGDPIEANAIGRGIARTRGALLPIGSIKTNIGHLEPASGLAGVLKAILALNHGILPPSLHFKEPNPAIDFERLKLTVCDQSMLLPNAANRYAGVNSFGFGGTNAHAIVAGGSRTEGADAGNSDTSFFVVSAETPSALAVLANTYAAELRFSSANETAVVASAIAHRREHLSHRIAVASSQGETVADALHAYVSGANHPHLTQSVALGEDLPVAFVYSGNGSQWAGMGRSAYLNNKRFREHFELVDGLFKQRAGWSLREAMFSEELKDRLPLTSVAQPLIFAIQSAATTALQVRGLQPAAVLGHSVGEVAAAEAAGILDLRQAVKVIYHRSTQQELTRGGGTMMAVLASVDRVEALARSIGDLEIAAINSPRAVTVAGATENLARLKRLAKSQDILCVELDLDYPFHTSMMQPVERPLLSDLKALHVSDARTPFISTVTGALLPGLRVNAQYWWRNVRDPVRFSEAVRAAAKLGARYFIEIGPRSTLLKHITDSLEGEVTGTAAVSVLERDDSGVDPFDAATSKALVSGAQIDLKRIFGPDPGPGIKLPTYPWQKQQYRFKPTPEALGIETDRHPFAGARLTHDDLEWRAHIDTVVDPQLLDHRVGEQTIFPGTGFLEIALAVARQWLNAETATISNFEILKPLDLTNGATREVLTRVSPGSSTVEIFSRPRLSQAPWLLHCRGKMLHANLNGPDRLPQLPQEGLEIGAERLYAFADEGGLHYGPAFRLARKVTIHDGGFVSIDLKPSLAPTPYFLDPMRLDCCTHSMITLFPDLHAAERGVTYIPVRLDEYTLFHPRAVPVRSVMQVLDKSDRSIFANYYILAEDGGLIAVLRGVRCQALAVKRVRSVETIALIERPAPIGGVATGESGVKADMDALLAAARSMADVADGGTPTDGPATLLLEGWATATAWEIANGLAEKRCLDIDLLVAKGQLPEELRSWLANLMGQLEGAELVRNERPGFWRLLPDSTLPAAASVVKALAAEHPARAGELLLCGALSGVAAELALEHSIAIEPAKVLTTAALDFYDSADAAGQAASDLVFKLLTGADGLWPRNRALRVLQLGTAPIAQLLAGRSDVELTVFEADGRRSESAQLQLGGRNGIVLLAEQGVSSLGTYDLIVSIDGLHRLPRSLALSDVKELLAPGGLLVAIESPPSLFKDLVFGFGAGWFDSGLGDLPLGPLQSGEHWQLELERAGFAKTAVCSVSCGDALASMLLARSDAATESVLSEPARVATAQKTLLFLGSSDQTEFAERIAAAAQAQLVMRPALDSLSDYSALAPDLVVLAGSSRSADPVTALTQRCLEIKACAEAVQKAPVPLWLVFNGALQASSGEISPVETGAWAFSRTVANEFRKLDVRRIDIAGNAAEGSAAEIGRLVVSGTTETELLVEGDVIRAVRIEQLQDALAHDNGQPAKAAVLMRRTGPGTRVTWAPAERRPPGPKDIEIAVEATGVNFRDLMWTLGLLPDDMLEDGFTGPALGLECAGTVTAVGASVDNFVPGARVVALAASAFATHVTIPASQAALLPQGMSSASGATIPVVFLTAYYSLVTLARVKRAEWLLVHGGAGGVGLAAIQIARTRGVNIIATAGSRAKRDLLRAMGVEHVLDSRAADFADEVRTVTGSGVDVVLNSLAGEAMERSIACLRPFGRFIELGKRDYVGNTHVGLRPFRKNLSYFGVDVDQLVGAKREQGERIFGQLIKQFETGLLTPLPHTIFPAHGASQALDLMQRSSHIGKLVVCPPQPGVVRAAHAGLTIRGDRTHVVTGAFGGFGSEAARWLADRGARHLVLIGRKGAVTAEARALVADLERRGVSVMAEPCDVADTRAVELLFGKIHAGMPPVAGVMHAAMVLDDAIVPNLDAARFETVLAPKVRGAENLDLVTRGLPLDYFILFSSVTTLIGNPGQGNYVAANAYMEGLARRRRSHGLAGLAIGWGPIIDVGVVARSEKLQNNLQRLVGVNGLRAREALDLMAQAMSHAAQPGRSAETAVMTISPSEGGFSSTHLPVLRSPTYRIMVRSDVAPSDGEAIRIDLHAMLQSESSDTVRRRVGDVIVTQLAHVLHSRQEDINRVRLLGELGLDSLMALELVVKLEAVFGFSIALAASAGSLSVAAVADEIIAQAGTEPDHDEAVLTTMAGQHGGEIDAKQLDTLKDIAEQSHKPRRLLS